MNMYSLIHENIKGGSSAQTLSKGPFTNVDHMIFFTHFGAIFAVDAPKQIVPLNLKRNDFMSLACIESVTEFILINYN